MPSSCVRARGAYTSDWGPTLKDWSFWVCKCTAFLWHNASSWSGSREWGSSTRICDRVGIAIRSGASRCFLTQLWADTHHVLWWDSSLWLSSTFASYFVYYLTFQRRWSGGLWSWTWQVANIDILYSRAWTGWAIEVSLDLKLTMETF